MKNTVIILGTAPTLAVTPWDNPDADYWACSPVITHPPFRSKDGKFNPVHRIDALFEIHNPDYWANPDVTKRLNDFSAKYPDAPIYMQEKRDAVCNSERYPLSQVQDFVNHPRMREYITSTIAYMVALAIMTGYKRIEMYGVHMASQEEEYSLQRECLTAWLAFGWGRGVDFWLPEESDVMKSSYLYGYQQENGFLLRAIKEKHGVEAGERDLSNKLEKLKQEYWMQKGGSIALARFVETLKKEGYQ